MTTPDPATAPGPERWLLSTQGGRNIGPFVEQFRGGGPQALTLQVDLARMHGGCAADAVREIVDVAGVTELRWLNRPAALPLILDDAARAVLSGYLVRVIDRGDSKPMTALFHRDAQAALVSTRVHGDDLVDQRTLHLADLVDQAGRHAAEWAAEQADTADPDLSFLPDPEPALRCTACLRIVGSGEGLDALDMCAGAVCGAAQLRSSEPCPGVLEPVMIVVAPRAPGPPRARATTVWAVVFSNYDPPEVAALYGARERAEDDAAERDGPWKVVEMSVD